MCFSTATQGGKHFSEVRISIEALRKIDSAEDALSLIGKQREAARFIALVAMTRQQQPELLDWLAKKPQHALELAEEWQRLLAIVAWLKAHPRPGVYLRQVDIPWDT
ncbi:DUF3322 domain-containing protein [Nitrosomonas sp. Nm33]|uniref:DUF3322 domain-containing protein n=1 Tax=Nitrosomonas sp. Nm33 TaxID=133724 RepID=UPI0008950BB8|nr:DUF3322 domain-containing protein [Nitrosomonas sp. Nm33]SDY75008.1 hypothetical protein SAMN05421755_10453 [Nitrosomonas sp. Nm33]